MECRLHLDILPQPDDSTCGPTCLQAVYRYYGDPVDLESVIAEVPMLDGGGTIAVLLGNHALRRGYQATILTYNLRVFDPTWFADASIDLADRLRRQAEFKQDDRIRAATGGYLEFLRLGGEIRFEDLTRQLLRSHLKRGTPVLTGLSSTYLYRSMREFGPDDDDDDIRGEPAGHFVVLAGYDRKLRSVQVADPYQENPVATGLQYSVPIDRVVGAILLGALTHDANLLLIRPRRRRSAPRKRTS